MNAPSVGAAAAMVGRPLVGKDGPTTKLRPWVEAWPAKRGQQVMFIAWQRWRSCIRADGCRA
eukprot:6701469-Prorocentrum_lima.AAC.1